MKKEIFWAIFIGFIVGLLITFGIWQANKAIKNNLPQLSQTNEPNPTPEANRPTLTILSPPNELLSKEPKTSLKGHYLPEAKIAVVYEKGEKITNCDKDGNFEMEIDLIAGENIIDVYGFSKDGDEVKQTLSVVHSTAEF